MMETKRKIALLQTLLNFDLSLKNETDVYSVLSKIGGLKQNYGSYMTTAPIDVDFELKRIQRANYELCCALMTMVLREDYFSNGSFIKRYQNGDIERIVRRMIFLLKDKRRKKEEVEWISEYEDYPGQTLHGKVRYILGTNGENPLIVVGTNPSAAVPEYPDRTVGVITNIVKSDNRFDSFLLINLYPQRATYPKELHKEIDFELHRKNCRHIQELLASLHKNRIVVWAAWGSLIHKREYLWDCLDDIVEIMGQYPCEWIQRGNFTNPHHPLYLRKEIPFEQFDVDKYMRDLRKKWG